MNAPVLLCLGHSQEVTEDMARVTVEDCIRYYPNRFEMVLLAARRARQLLKGMPSVVDDGETHKPVVQALKEMGEGHITWEAVFDLEARERERLRAAEAAGNAEEHDAAA